MNVRKHSILCFTHIAYRCVLGLYMAVCGAQNTVYANSQSRVAPVWPFVYLGRVKNHRAVITTILRNI